MNPYAAYGLEREPFSNSPDPNFLLATRQHATCLQELEISLRLRRGLNVVTGDIGTGKTTLCRSLLRIFAEEPNTDVHLLLDPHFATSEEFLRVILASVSGLSPEPDMGVWALKEALKQQLFRLGLVEKRLVILAIDEGQKIAPQHLEILREMLNYETNTAKLLQIVIFGQRELEPMIAAMPNLADRINVRRRLSPLSFAETRQMIRHRLAVAAGEGQPRVRFSLPAMWTIHKAGGGSPRKTIRLCHMAMLEMMVRGETMVGRAEVRAVLRPERISHRRQRRLAGLAAIGCLGMAAAALWLSLRADGPIMGEGATAQKSESRMPIAPQAQAPANQASPAVQSGQEIPPARPAAESGPAPAAAQGPSLRADGLSLQGERAEAPAEQPARVSLLPQRDQGPDMRGKIDGVRPAKLQVELTGYGADARLGGQLAQKAGAVQER